MYFAIVMVCGITLQSPYVVDTCGMAHSNKPVRTLSECNQLLFKMVDDYKSTRDRVGLDSSFVTEAKCVPLNTGA